jgi:hypothetical protein
MIFFCFLLWRLERAVFFDILFLLLSLCYAVLDLLGFLWVCGHLLWVELGLFFSSRFQIKLPYHAIGHGLSFFYVIMVRGWSF